MPPEAPNFLTVNPEGVKGKSIKSRTAEVSDVVTVKVTK